MPLSLRTECNADTPRCLVLHETLRKAVVGLARGCLLCTASCQALVVSASQNTDEAINAQWLTRNQRLTRPWAH